MTVFDYRCSVCGYQFVKDIQPPGDPDTMVCPNCTSMRVDRLVSLGEEDSDEDCFHLPGGG